MVNIFGSILNISSLFLIVRFSFTHTSVDMTPFLLSERVFEFLNDVDPINSSEMSPKVSFLRFLIVHSGRFEKVP